jgi:hypothetical protein
MKLGENSTWIDVSNGWMSFGKSNKGDLHDFLKILPENIGRLDRFRIEARGNSKSVGCFKFRVIAFDDDS